MLPPTDIDRWAGLSLWQHLDALVAGSVVIVDRPRGSAHPKVPGYVYPLDYGYLEGTNGGDGSGIDVWRGAAHRRGVTAVLCTFDPVKRNSELKVVMDCTDDELGEIESFYRPQPQAVMVVRRPG